MPAAIVTNCVPQSRREGGSLEPLHDEEIREEANERGGEGRTGRCDENVTHATDTPATLGHQLSPKILSTSRQVQPIHLGRKLEVRANEKRPAVLAPLDRFLPILDRFLPIAEGKGPPSPAGHVRDSVTSIGHGARHEPLAIGREQRSGDALGSDRMRTPSVEPEQVTPQAMTSLLAFQHDFTAVGREAGHAAKVHRTEVERSGFADTRGQENELSRQRGFPRQGQLAVARESDRGSLAETNGFGVVDFPKVEGTLVDLVDQEALPIR